MVITAAYYLLTTNHQLLCTSQGAHHIATEVIERSYYTGIYNLVNPLYTSL